MSEIEGLFLHKLPKVDCSKTVYMHLPTWNMSTWTSISHKKTLLIIQTIPGNKKGKMLLQRTETQTAYQYLRTARIVQCIPLIIHCLDSLTQNNTTHYNAVVSCAIVSIMETYTILLKFCTFSCRQFVWKISPHFQSFHEIYTYKF